MPLLPSGLKLSLSRHALFDHGGNWFECPEGHFWYWAPDAQIMGPAPYELGSEIIRSAEHAPAPSTIDEVKKFIYVLECEHENKWGWRGEWLDQFPQYRILSPEDQSVWCAWVESEEIQKYLQETVQICKRLAHESRSASGVAIFNTRNDRT